jgi:acyl-coenzyme A thioesterase PaaI-like protein
VEFKINLLRPAVGDRLTAEAVVLKEGRTLTICQSTIRAHAADRVTTVAVMMQTNMRMRAAGST